MAFARNVLIRSLGAGRQRGTPWLRRGVAGCGESLALPQQVPVEVPDGTTYARFSLFAEDANPGTDVDMCVFRDEEMVGASLNPWQNPKEEVNLADPQPGTYIVVVDGFWVGDSTPFKLHSWTLGGQPAGNLTVVAPQVAKAGTKGTVELTVGDLGTGRYLGAVDYSGVPDSPAPTIVRVDVP